MHVIITGGTGLIGRALAADMAADGHDVLVLSRAPERASGVPAGVRVERWDGVTAVGWGHMVNGAGAVVNLAGENIGSGRWTGERKRRIRESRLNAGQAVFAAVQGAADRPGVIIQASGAGYYGPRGDEEVTESSAPGDDFLARLAVEWEDSTARLQQFGVRWAGIRTGMVLSTDGGALPRLRAAARLLCAGRSGSGRQWVSWVHVADEVAAIRFLIDNREARGPFNLTAPAPVTNEAFMRALGNRLGRPVRVPVPAIALRLVFGEMAATVLDGQRAIPRRLLETGFSFRFAGLDDALMDLLA